MKTVLFIFLAICLLSFAAAGQEVYDLKGLEIPNLNKPLKENPDYTPLDLADKVFPNVTDDDNELSRSIPIRRLEPRVQPLVIDRKMRIYRIAEYQVKSAGKKLTAMLFHLENSRGAKSPLDVLAIYRFEPKPVLIDAIDARFGDWKNDSAEFGKSTFHLRIDPSENADEALQMVNRRKVSAAQTDEIHRFLWLNNKGKLLVIAQTPVLTAENKKVSFEVEIGDPLYDGDTNSFELQITRNSGIASGIYKGADDVVVVETENYDLRQDKKSRVYKAVLTDRGGYIQEAWGSYLADKYVRYDPARLRVGGGYRAEAFYNPRTGDIRLVAPGKFPRGTTVKLEFNDFWGVSSSDAKKIVRDTVEFQIISEETTVRNGRRRTEYECLIYAFGKRSRFAN